MKKGFFLRILVLILFLGGCLYSYLDLQNEITQLRIDIPKLSAEVRRIEEENTHFSYEIKCFESPENLMKIVRSSEFSHLRFPMGNTIVTLRQASPIGEAEEQIQSVIKTKPSIQFAAGAQP